MPKYRLSGTYYFPPDRGSPNGEEKRFSKEFQAPNAQKAREWVAEYKEKHQQILRPRLARIVVRGKTSPIQL